jgi:hypothetical protein
MLVFSSFYTQGKGKLFARFIAFVLGNGNNFKVRKLPLNVQQYQIRSSVEQSLITTTS